MYASQQSINRLTHLGDDDDDDEINVPIILHHVNIDRNQVWRSYSATKNQQRLFSERSWCSTRTRTR